MGEAMPTLATAMEGGDKFRCLFSVVAQMAGSQSCGSAYLKAPCTCKGKTARECVAISPAEFYQQVDPAGCPAGFMERARVYLLYCYVHAAAENAAAAVIGATHAEEMAREAADRAVADLYENPEGEFFQKLRSVYSF